MSLSLIAIALFVASTATTAPQGASYAEGIAKHYYPGLMRSVLKVRQRQGLIPYGVSGYDGLASSTDCSRIGQYVAVALRNPRTGRWSAPRRMLLVDCSHPRDRARHVRSGLVIEVDYWTAESAGFAWDGRRGEGKTRARVWRVGE